MGSATDSDAMDMEQARAQLAPSGVLKAAINLGNPILVQQDLRTGELGGVAIGLARALAARLAVKLELVPFETPGLVTDSAGSGAWNVALLAVQPAREKVIDFSAPYLAIEGAYVVWNDAPYTGIDDIDRPGVRIAVGTKTAYELFLSRQIKHAELVHAPSSEASLQLFLEGRLEAAAGIRQALEAFAAGHRDLRVLEGQFMAIEQAMGVPKGRQAAASYLRSFVNEMKSAGFVADELARSGQDRGMALPVSGTA
ncbi:MAG: transporter substrate-binding domain-containing protein [Phyllobacterium sp.]